MSNTLDNFGKFIVEYHRDKTIDSFLGTLQNKWGSDSARRLQKKMSRFNREEKRIIAELVDDLLENSMHDLLHAFQMGNDIDGNIKIIMDNENVAEMSDGLHGEIFSEDGWIQRFTRHKSFPENI